MRSLGARRRGSLAAAQAHGRPPHNRIIPTVSPDESMQRNLGCRTWTMAALGYRLSVCGAAAPLNSPNLARQSRAFQLTVMD